MERSPESLRSTIDPETRERRTRRRTRIFGIGVVAAGAAVLASGTFVMSVRAEHRVNRTPLSATAPSVSVMRARKSTYRPARSYVGTVEPWLEASVGPQYVSAYVKTVLVRPGAAVHEGQVLATLDCSNPTAVTRAMKMRVQALDAETEAASSEATRVSALLPGGFVSQNEAQIKNSASEASKARLGETLARLESASLDVHDCVLRAPFTGEIGSRSFDPGAFVRPGAEIVSIVDRDVVRVTLEAPEKDFEALAPATPVSIGFLAVDKHLVAPVARRTPRAQQQSRTIHVEIDVPDPDRQYPVGTTALIELSVGKPVPASEIPVYAAELEGETAKFFVVENGVAHARSAKVVGESGAELFVDPGALADGASVVTEGRALVSEGDRVREHPDVPPAGSAAPVPSTESVRRGGGFGRPL